MVRLLALLLLLAPLAYATDAPKGDLVRRDSELFDELWMRPYFDVRTYSKMLLEPPVIEYAAATAPITAEQQKWLHDIVDDAFRDELAQSKYFKPTDRAAPDTLTVKIKLRDVVSYGASAPADPNRSLADVGAATLELILDDSLSKTVTARAIAHVSVERTAADQADTSRTASSHAVERAAREWAKRVRERLDAIGSVALNPTDEAAQARD